MASIKVKYRASTVEGHDGAIFYQIIHDRRVRHLGTNYRVNPDEWDEKRSIVKSRQPGGRRALIRSILERIRWDVERLKKICRRLEKEGMPYTADDIIFEFKRYARQYSLFNYMENIIAKLKRNGKCRTAETYTATLNSFRKFLSAQQSTAKGLCYEDLMLDSITSEVMEAYEAWHRKRGNSPNTISFYTRILRAVYNRAVEEEIIENRHPFRHVYTGVEKTVKRAIPLTHLKRIKALDLKGSPALDYARDMFMIDRKSVV